MPRPMTKPLTNEQRALAGQWFAWSQKFALKWINRFGLQHCEAAARSAASLALMMAASTWKAERGAFRTWATMYLRAMLHKMRAQETGAVRRRMYRIGVDKSLHEKVKPDEDTIYQDFVPADAGPMSWELAFDIAHHGASVLDGLREKLADRVPHSKSATADAAAAAVLASFTGATLQDIAIDLGVSRERARQYVATGAAALERFGAEVRGEAKPFVRILRPRRAPTQKTGPKMSPERQAVRDEVIRRYVVEGESGAKVGAEFKVTPSTVLLWVRQAGHPVRDRGGNMMAQHNEERNVA